MEIIYTNGMITINETMVVILVSFLLLVFILNRLMFRPLLNTIKEREDHLTGLSDEIKTAEQKAEDLARQLKDHETAAQQEAQRLKKELEAAGSSQATEILNQSREESQAIKEEAQKEVKAHLEAARQDLHREAENICQEIMTTILGRNVSAPDA
ncbi:MAG: hypothetical protein R6U29_12460 [Desulfosudaceae bacterium]